MTRFEQFIMISRRTAGTLGIALLIGWIIFLVIFQLYLSATYVPDDEPAPQAPVFAPEVVPEIKREPALDEARPNCIRMEDSQYVCDKQKA